jgi:hypothetical protein
MPKESGVCYGLFFLFDRVFLGCFDGPIDRRTFLNRYLFALFVCEAVLYTNLTIEILSASIVMCAFSGSLGSIGSMIFSTIP